MEAIEKQQILSYVSCNLTSLICLSIILPTMFVSIIVIKLFVSSDIHKRQRVCSPISYFFGEKTGCRQTIQDSIHRENFETNENQKQNYKNLLITSSKYILSTNEYIKSSICKYLVKIINLLFYKS